MTGCCSLRFCRYAPVPTQPLPCVTGLTFKTTWVGFCRPTLMFREDEIGINAEMTIPGECTGGSEQSLPPTLTSVNCVRNRKSIPHLTLLISVRGKVNL